MTCPYVQNCKFEEKLHNGETLRSISEKSLKKRRENHCNKEDKDPMDCARHKLANVIGIENVPFIIMPNDHDYVDKIMKTQDYKEKLVDLDLLAPTPEPRLTISL